MSVDDLTRGLKALADSRAAYEEAEGYYTGKVGEFFASSAIAKKIEKAGSSFHLAFAAIPVDARVGGLDIASITAASGEAVTKILRERVWDANELDQDIEDVFRKAGYFGDYFMTVWPTSGEDDEAESEVEIFANSPLTTRIIYSRANARRALFAIRLWQSDEAADRYRVNLLYPDRIEQWITAPGKKPASGADFVPYLDEDDEADDDSGIIENEFGVIPVFHFRQGSKPYGTPIHARAYGSQDAITKLSSTHMATVDYLGFPQRYALIDDKSEGEDGDDDWIDFDTSGVVVPGQAVEMKSRRSKLKSGPGETWWLDGVKGVGQFEPASHEPFLEPMKFHVRAMARLTGTPAAEFDIETGEVPSGESYRRAYVPLRRDVQTIRRGHGATLGALLSLALEMLGHPGEKVTVTWAPLEVAAGKEDWEIISMKVKAGVPLRVALIDAGFSDEEVLKWYPDGEPAFSPEVFGMIASAMASLATPTTLGLTSPEDARRAFPDFFTDDRTETPAVLPEVDDDATIDEVIDATIEPAAPASTAGQDAIDKANAIKAQADALGALVRAGANQESAARFVGLEGLTFSGIPTTVRPSADEADEFESKDGAPAPAAVAPPAPVEE